MGKRKPWVAAVMLAVMSSGCTRTSVLAASSERDTWYGLYLQGQKIGFAREAIKPVERNGRKLFEYVEHQYTRTRMNGRIMEQGADTLTVCDEQLNPLEGTFTTTSAGRQTRIEAHFGAGKIDCVKTDAAGRQTPQVAEIPAGVKLVADERLVLAAGRLEVGKQVDMWQFNPVSVSVEKHELKAVRKEALALVGETIDALVVEIHSPWVNATAWVDEQGRVRKLEAKMGEATLEFREEAKDLAMTVDTGGAGVDLMAATAIRPDKPIVGARGVGRLVLKVRGLELVKEVPQGHWQRVEDAGDGWRKLTIDALEGLPEPGPTDAERAAYLKATAYIQSDHPDIVAATKAALDGATTPAAKAEKLGRWVHGRVRWQSDIGLFRSALEVLHDPNGVCRDAAALYTALARAAGVPTRVCSGVEYVGDSFLGHAWAESWTGDKWLVIDATLPQTFVDATHLKLAQGADYTQLFEMLPAMGNLKVQVLEVTMAKP